MSRIYKGVFGVEVDEKIVIDSNDMLREKIEKYEKERKEKMRKEMLEQRTADDPDFEGEDVSALFEDEEAVAFDEEMVKKAQEEADAILLDAQERANAILEDAMASSDAMKEQAIKEGEKKGYSQGQALAEGELAVAKEALESERAALQAEFERKLVSMEREITDVVCDVINRVFMADMSDKKSVLYHLIENAVSNIDSSGEFLIKVNQDEYEYLISLKDNLSSSLGSTVTLEFACDPVLGPGECLIETDGGMFDCSLGTELEGLLNEIKILSSR